MMPSIIYPDDSNNEKDYTREASSDPPSTDSTSEPGTPIEKATEEPTSETDSDVLSEPSAPMGEGSMGHLSPGDILRHHKGSDPPIFATIEERTNEASWGDVWKIRILGQEKSLESGEDLLTPTNITSPIITKLYEVENMR